MGVETKGPGSKKLEEELESDIKLETRAAKTLVKENSVTEAEPKSKGVESRAELETETAETLVKEKSGTETEPKPSFEASKSVNDMVKTLKEQKPNSQAVKEMDVDDMQSEVEPKEAEGKDTSNEREMLQLEGVSLKLTRRVVDVVIASLPSILKSESTAAVERLMRATLAIWRLEIPEPPFETLVNCLSTIPEEEWKSEHCAGGHYLLKQRYACGLLWELR